MLVKSVPFLILLRLAAAATIPTTLSTSSPIQTTSAMTPSTIPSITSSNSNDVPMTSGVAQGQPQTGHNYALDPFGFLGSSQGQEGTTNGDQQAKQTQISKATQTSPGSGSATNSKSDPTSNAASSSGIRANNAGSATSSSKLSVLSTGTAHESSTQAITSPSSTTSGNTATPTAKSNDNSKSEPSSASSMNSWKIIGIGVLSFAGIVALVLGTAFQDAIFRAMCRPFRRRKDDSNEVLIPDWRHGSWRFDEVNTEKSGFEEDEGPRIGELEKRGLAFPLPPVSPFPLRRTPSLNTRAPADAGKAGIGAGTAAVTNAQDKHNSTFPSPTPVMNTPPTPRDQDNRSPIPIQSRIPRKRPQSEAYGGME